MKNIPLFCLLFCCLLFVPAHADKPLDCYGRTIVKQAILRSAPSKSGDVIKRVPFDSMVWIVADTQGYYLCRGPQAKRFYVSKWMVKVVPGTIMSPLFHHWAKPVIHLPQYLPPKRTTYSLSPAQDYGGRVSFADTQNKWWKVENSSGYVHFRNVGVANNQFSAEVAIDGTIFKPTSKPIEVHFLVSIFGSDGNLVARDQVSVSDVASDGGEYAIVGPFVNTISPISPVYCSIKYSGAWTYGK